MREQMIFVDADGTAFVDPSPPEEQILNRIREFIASGKLFRFEDCLRGIETPEGKDRRGYSYLLRPFIADAEIIKVAACHSSEPAHHWGWKTQWIRADRISRCPTCHQVWLGGNSDAA